MIAALRNWFEKLSGREQWMVGVAAVLAGILLLIFAIILPSISALENAKTAHEEAVQRRGRIEANVEAALAQKPSKTAASEVNVDLVVTQGAVEKGFELIKSANSVPGQMSFRMDKARAPALLAWLSELEGQGIAVQTIALRSAADGSITVDAQLRRSSR